MVKSCITNQADLLDSYRLMLIDSVKPKAVRAGNNCLPASEDTACVSYANAIATQLGLIGVKCPPSPIDMPYKIESKLQNLNSPTCQTSGLLVKELFLKISQSIFKLVNILLAIHCFHVKKHKEICQHL